MYAGVTTNKGDYPTFEQALVDIFLPDNKDLCHLISGVHSSNNPPKISEAFQKHITGQAGPALVSHPEDTQVLMENHDGITFRAGISVQSGKAAANFGSSTDYPEEHSSTTNPSMNAVLNEMKVEQTEIVSSWKCQAVFIPTKEALSFAPGQRGMYDHRELHVERVYVDLVTSCILPALREHLLVDKRALLRQIEGIIGGVVKYDMREKFFIVSDKGTMEFDLVAEGHRKLGIIWLLIQNGMLAKDSILFWDEPEANMNPKLIKVLVGILCELQHLGVQIIASTHNSNLLQEIDLQTTADNKVSFHSLHRAGDEVKCKTTQDFNLIDPDPILDAGMDIVDRHAERIRSRLLKTGI